MAKRQTEEEQNLRRKARRRLIGAIALTLAVVVVLPMVLDSEPRPTGRDIDLRIPDPDKAGEFIPGVAVPHEPVTGGANSNASAGSAVEVAVPGNEPAAASKARTEAPGKVQLGVQKPAKSPVKPSAADKPASAVTEGFVAQVGAYSNADTAKQELNKLKKWGFKAYIEKAGDKIRVRVGPYAEREKAEKVRLQLEKHELHPVVMSTK